MRLHRSYRAMIATAGVLCMIYVLILVSKQEKYVHHHPQPPTPAPQDPRRYRPGPQVLYSPFFNYSANMQTEMRVSDVKPQASIDFWFAKSDEMNMDGITQCDQLTFAPTQHVDGNGFAFNWDKTGPEKDFHDHFVVCGQGWLPLWHQSHTAYAVQCHIDDGIQLWLDDGADGMIFDHWDQLPGTLSFNTIIEPKEDYTEEGNWQWHRLQLRYQEKTGDALLACSWQPIPWRGYVATWYAQKQMIVPLFQTWEPFIDANWQHQSPFPSLIEKDEFAIEYRGYFPFKLGWHKLCYDSDDGLIIQINGIEHVNQWNVASHARKCRIVWIPQGVHEIVVKYFDFILDASIYLYWEWIAAPETTICSKTLATTPSLTCPPIVENDLHAEYFTYSPGINEIFEENMYIQCTTATASHQSMYIAYEGQLLIRNDQDVIYLDDGTSRNSIYLEATPPLRFCQNSKMYMNLTFMEPIVNLFSAYADHHLERQLAYSTAFMVNEPHMYWSAADAPCVHYLGQIELEMNKWIQFDTKSTSAQSANVYFNEELVWSMNSKHKPVKVTQLLNWIQMDACRSEDRAEIELTWSYVTIPPMQQLAVTSNLTIEHQYVLDNTIYVIPLPSQYNAQYESRMPMCSALPYELDSKIANTMLEHHDVSYPDFAYLPVLPTCIAYMHQLSPHHIPDLHTYIQESVRAALPRLQTALPIIVPAFGDQGEEVISTLLNASPTHQFIFLVNVAPSIPDFDAQYIVMPPFIDSWRITQAAQGGNITPNPESRQIQVYYHKPTLETSGIDTTRWVIGSKDNVQHIGRLIQSEFCLCQTPSDTISMEHAICITESILTGCIPVLWDSNDQFAESSYASLVQPEHILIQFNGPDIVSLQEHLNHVDKTQFQSHLKSIWPLFTYTQDAMNALSVSLYQEFG